MSSNLVAVEQIFVILLFWGVVVAAIAYFILSKVMREA